MRGDRHWKCYFSRGQILTELITILLKKLCFGSLMNSHHRNWNMLDIVFHLAVDFYLDIGCILNKLLHSHFRPYSQLLTSQTDAHSYYKTYPIMMAHIKLGMTLILISCVACVTISVSTAIGCSADKETKMGEGKTPESGQWPVLVRWNALLTVSPYV